MQYSYILVNFDIHGRSTPRHIDGLTLRPNVWSNFKIHVQSYSEIQITYVLVNSKTYWWSNFETKCEVILQDPIYGQTPRYICKYVPMIRVNLIYYNQYPRDTKPYKTITQVILYFMMPI